MLSRFLCYLNADDVPNSNLFFHFDAIDPFTSNEFHKKGRFRRRLENVPSLIVIFSNAKTRRFVEKKIRLLMVDAYILFCAQFGNLK